MPFSPSTREDSIKRVTERIEALRDASNFYEKTYLQGSLVYMPVDSVLFSSITNKPVLLWHEVENGTLPHWKNLLKIYSRIRKNVKKEVRKSNRERARRNRETKREIRKSPAAQMDIVKFRKSIEDFEFVFLPQNNFTKISFNTPTDNSISQSLDDELRQSLLGHATDVESYISSINYSFDIFDNMQHPALIQDLLTQNLKHAISLVKSRDSLLIKDVKLNLKDYLSPSGKLWINTDVSKKEIYLSPYLIRAVFMMSYYEVRLMKLIENKTKKRVRTFIGGKGSNSSPITIDSAYFQNFVNRFSWNLQFVLSHELAHIYLKESNAVKLEFECDCSAYFWIRKAYQEWSLGVFDSLIVASIRNGEAFVWDIKDGRSHIDRFDVLMRLKEGKPLPSDCAEIFSSESNK